MTRFLRVQDVPGKSGVGIEVVRFKQNPLYLGKLILPLLLLVNPVSIFVVGMLFIYKAHLS